MLRPFLLAGSLIVTCELAVSDEPTIIDLGNIPQGTSKTQQFSVPNPYAEPLQIREVQKSCGCTEVNISEKYKVVPVGQDFEGQITVEVPSLLGVAPEKFASLVKVIGTTESHIIELPIRGTVIPSLIAVDGVPRFRLSSPPAPEQLDVRFSLKSTAKRLPDLTAEVLSPHCVSDIDDLENGSAIVSLKLLDSVRTYRPRELRVRILSSGDLVAEFPVYCTYQTDLRIIAERKQILRRTDAPKRSFRLYFGEAIRSLETDSVEATFVWDSHTWRIPMVFSAGSEAKSLKTADLDLSQLIEKMPSGSHGRLTLKTTDDRNVDSIEIWIE